MVSNLHGNDHRMIAILKILSESTRPLGSHIISRELERFGIKLSASSVRYLFRITDIRGYTQSVVHNGRIITPYGLEKLESAFSEVFPASPKRKKPVKTNKPRHKPKHGKS